MEFSLQDPEDVLCFVAPYVWRPGKLARVSRRLREVVDNLWPARARAIGVLDPRPLGLTWLDVMKESLRDSSGRQPHEVMDEGFFEEVEESWRERGLPVGATCSVGVFEGAFLEDFLVKCDACPAEVSVESRDFYDRGMSYGGPPFGIRYYGCPPEYKEMYATAWLPEEEAGPGLGLRLPSRAVLPKVIWLGRLAVGADSQAQTLEWAWGNGVESAILQPPASWGQTELSADGGIIRDITREQLDDSGRCSMADSEEGEFTHAVGVHFAMCATFVVWDSDAAEGPLLSPAELEVRDGFVDEDSCQGGTGALQLWRGNTFICGVSCYGGRREEWYDTRCARVTIEQIVD